MGKKHKPEPEETIEEPSEASGETPSPPAEKQAQQPKESEEEQLERELESTRAEAAKNWDLYLRERAELENFRKRTQRDKEDAIRFANDRLLKEMIPVLDNLERALDHAGENRSTQQGLLEGVDMTITMFRKVLEDFGVQPVSAAGEAFDPNLHQAMSQVETSEHPPNTVVTEFQKGYKLNERLLRPALVVVAKAPAETSAPNQDSTSAESDKDSR
ncbi:MAG: nucleotide exchange factor GrpE [Deltaproteobacteria bacterium]|nr:nucleotide exchange factor GrpE [Deltaproteobacteria bacterium]MBW2520677.1 nucleotide exchange factor GrpE [Deltaproteobacteria bacterium]